ncbi:hypothetical protein ACGTJS_11015 [Faucicola mancuniensis]|uniref:hypothetical protein n=1 Tax=Faucicola mancuniensis TaxID=1309795 RepID=UPI00397735E3
MKLSEITEKTPLIKDFSNRLAKTTRQRIATVVINKIKRVSGVSSLPVDMNLENNQKVTCYIRIVDEKADMWRIDINGKQLPITGDLDNSYKPSFNKSVDDIAKAVVAGQKAFDKKMARQKTPSVTRTSTKVSQTKQLEELAQQAQDLDNTITQKQAEKQTLSEQLQALIDETIV